MFYAEKIKMKAGCYFSQQPEEIDEIYISEVGFYKKEVIHSYVKEHPGTIRVKIPPIRHLSLPSVPVESHM